MDSTPSQPVLQQVFPENYQSFFYFYKDQVALHPWQKPFWSLGEILFYYDHNEEVLNRFPKKKGDKKIVYCIHDDVQNWVMKRKPPIPHQVISIASGNWCLHEGKRIVEWLGIDLDVGHGLKEDAYNSFGEALNAAKSVWESIPQFYGVRSTSGQGIHLKLSVGHLRMYQSDGHQLLENIVHRFNLKCDKANLSRQTQNLWTRKPEVNSFEVLHPASEATSYLPSECLSRFASQTFNSPDYGKDEKEKKESCCALKEARQLLEQVTDDVSSRSSSGNRNFKEILSLKKLGLPPEEARNLMLEYKRDVLPIAEYERIYKNYRLKGSPKVDRHYLFDVRHPVWKTMKRATFGAFTQIVRNKVTHIEFGNWSYEFEFYKGELGGCHATNNRCYWNLILLGLLRITKEQTTLEDGTKSKTTGQIRYPKDDEEVNLIVNAKIIKENLKDIITPDNIQAIRKLLILHSEGNIT